MFKLESYITPIILSQVERYVKNVRAEDSQVSLWGGDAVFNNLDLRLEVLEEELHLPFSLVSGHIHELQIHVPWTRLNTEPIVLTINTIECVLKLPGDRASSVASSEDASSVGSSKTTGEEKRKVKKKQEEQGAPPGYIQGLINKVISNIQIVCNNLILKYVEEDLVLSLNVRTASLSSCDEAWNPAFSELSLPHLVLRKLLQVSDLTICLDRRGALGKIEVYQDPLLYRCSLAVRVAWHYQHLTSKTPHRTVISLLAEKMEWSVTGVQLPMVVRLASLFFAFYFGELGASSQIERKGSGKEKEKEKENEEEEQEEEEMGAGLGSLLWDVGTTVGGALLPIYWEEEDIPPPTDSGEALPVSSLLGIYIREITITLKLATSVKQKGFYGAGKQALVPHCVARAQGVYSEVSGHGLGWTVVQAGASQISVTPLSHPAFPADQASTYLLAGCEGEAFLRGSLFEDKEAEAPSVEIASRRDNWESHLERHTETLLLERSPALALDYMYNLELPGEDQESVSLSDLEHSDLPERALARVVIGPASIQLTEGALARCHGVASLVRTYEYPTYWIDRLPPGPEGLQLPSQEEVARLEGNSPQRIVRLTVLHPSLALARGSARLDIGLRCLDLAHQVPMYPLRNVKAACLMHPPSRTILQACHSTTSLTMEDTWVKLSTSPSSSFRLATLDRAVLTHRTLLHTQFWRNLYQRHGDITAKLDCLQLTGNPSQLRLASALVEGLSEAQPKEVSQLVTDCSAAQPALVVLLSSPHVSYTWTSQLFTLGVTMDSLTLSLRSSGKAKAAPLFSGSAPVPRSSQGWLALNVQWPLKAVGPGLPTMFHLHLGETVALADPRMKDVLNFCSALQKENDTSENQGTERSSKAAGAPPQRPNCSNSQLLACLSGTVVDISTSRLSLHLADRNLGASGTTVGEAVARAGRAKNGVGVLTLSLASVKAHNASGRTDLAQFTTHPVLFPPAVWSPGKDNLPWSITLCSLSLEQPASDSVILAPVTTSCTLGSSPGPEHGEAICLHADLSSVELTLDQNGIACAASIASTISAALLPVMPAPVPAPAVQVDPVTGPVPHILQRSLGSVSESATPITSGHHSTGGPPNNPSTPGPTSLWLQWTLPLAAANLVTPTDTVRLTLEDCSASLDKQPHYTKSQIRVRSLTGSLAGQGGTAAPFPGKVISCRPRLLRPLYVYSPDTGGVEELDGEDDIVEGRAVFNLTVTCAEVQGLAKKLRSSASKEKLVLIDAAGQPTRFLTEFDVEVGPIDVFLPTKLLQPLLNLSKPLLGTGKANKKSNSPVSSSLLPWNSSTLPMAYVKAARLRLFLLLPDASHDPLLPDFLLVQLQRASLTAQVENPLSRILVDVPLYHEAAGARLLGVPGSLVEDRQYQADIAGVTIATGHWTDVVERNKPVVRPLLRTMSENPALEWNSGREGREEASDVVLVPILHNVHLKMVAAPAIVYRKFLGGLATDVLVAGISAEVNAVTDVNLVVSIQQLALLSALGNQLSDLAQKQEAPAPIQPLKVGTDSGVESEQPQNSSDRAPPSGCPPVVPLEVLLTCNSLRLAAHKYEATKESVTAEDVKMWRRYLHSERREVAQDRRMSEGSEETEDETRREVNVLEMPRKREEQEEGTEAGYEASEEESTIETGGGGSVRLVPLAAVTLTHPHIFVSLSSAQQKADLSIYDLHFACAPPRFHLPANAAKKIPWPRDFPTTLMETCQGKADPKSGVRPALVTVTMNGLGGEEPRLAVKVERPVQVVLSKQRCGQVLKVKQELVRVLGGTTDDARKEDISPSKMPVQGVSVSTVQLVMVWEEKEVESCSVKASLGSIDASVELEQIKTDLHLSLSCSLERLALSLHRGSLGHSLLDPLSLSVTGSKQISPQMDLTERLKVQIELQQLQLHMGPHHLHIMKQLYSSLESLLKDHNTSQEMPREDTKEMGATAKEEEEEQHYQDDLRIGAFQVLDPVLEGEAGKPAPYQLVSDSSSLTWCYPQPRALTRVVIFPLPFVEASEFSFSEGAGERVDCELLHWADTVSSFVVYSTFQLSESQVLHLDLPLIRDRRACAASTMWRVRLSRQADQAYISPLALVSVLKVDSYSSPSLLPSSSLSVRASSLVVHLHNHLHYAGQQLAPNLPLEDLELDTSFPPDQLLATLTVSPLTLGANLWPPEDGQPMMQSSLKARVGLDFVDQTFLALHHLLAPVEVNAGVQLWRGQADTSLNVGRLHLAAGPLFLHAMRQSMGLWEQVTERLAANDTESPAPYIPLVQIIVVNETSQVVRFGQAGTEENIPLQPRHAAPYAWRSQRANQLLRIAVEGRDWTWGEPFSLVPGQKSMVLGEAGGLHAVLQVDLVTPSLRLVRVMGLLSVLSLLREHLELRLVPPAGKETRCLVGSYARPTTLIADCTGVVLKVRFLGLGTPWSGDIPIEAVVGKRKSFMVKLPLQEKGSCSTIWCSILSESLGGSTRQLVTFSPLYVLTSLQPSPLTVSLALPGKDGALQFEAAGRGASQQLDIPAPPETKFNMSFSVSPDLPSSSPPIAVSWGIIDQVREKTRPVPSIDSVLASVPSHNLRSPPSSGLSAELAGLAIAGLPLTDCRVTFSEFHPATNTLSVRVAPTVLLVNRCPMPVLSQVAEGASWLMAPQSVLHPSLQAETKLQLGLDLLGEEVWGPELELSEQDWTYVSLRPSQQGVLHLHSSLQYAITAPTQSAFLTVESSFVEGVRLITIRPTFLVVNRTDQDVMIRGEIQPELTVKNKAQNVPDIEEKDKPATVVSPNGTASLLWWPQVARGGGHLTHHILLSSSPEMFSSRFLLPLDKDARHCTNLQGSHTDLSRPVLLASHREKNQVYIVILADPQPQAFLHNLLPVPVSWREEGQQKSCGNAAAGAGGHLTLPWLQEGFPFCEQETASKRLQLGLEGEPGTQAANWSQGVDLTSTQETFLRLPGHGDVRVKVEALQPTTHIYLEPVSHLEVAARDIRARFSSPASPEQPFFSPNASFVTVPSAENSFKTTVDESTEEEDSVSVSSSFTLLPNSTNQYTGTVLSLKVQELSLALTDDLMQFPDLQEVLRLTATDVDVRMQPRTDFSTLYQALGGRHLTSTELSLKVQDIQVDNQLFPRGLFHFPVLVSRQTEHGGAMVQVAASLVQGVTKEFRLQLQPLAICLEDTFVYQLQEFIGVCLQSGTLIKQKTDPDEEVPKAVIWAVESSNGMLFHPKVVIEQVDLQVSAHASVKVHVGLEDSKISLSRFDASSVWATWYSLGHRLSRHYLSGALFKAGWVVGSLDMLGSPAAFTRNVTDGMKDFVALPYEGLWRGPWGLLVGLTAGSSSLVKHVSAGTLTSITNFASSMSRNLDKLSLDQEHQVRNEETRRQRPQGVGEGLLNGLSTVGVSILGAVGGLAHHPIQVLLEEGLAPVSLVGGVGRGMVGVVTKPLGSAAELIAQTGQGMLTGSGWSRDRLPRASLTPGLVLELPSSSLKFQWKVMGSASAVTIVAASQVHEGLHAAVTVVLSRSALYIHSEEEDAVRSVFSLAEVTIGEDKNDPTLLVVRPTKKEEAGYSHVSDRVARFVLESIHFAETGGGANVGDDDGNQQCDNQVQLFMGSQARLDFCTIFKQVKEEHSKLGFPVLC